MKATIGALMMSTSALVLGSVVATEAAVMMFALLQGGISASTPIQGLTLGLIVVGGGTALVAAIKGAKALVMFTLACGKWIETMNETVVRVTDQQKEIAALQRWRDHIVDPLLTRSGVGKPNPASEVQVLYDEEAAS